MRVPWYLMAKGKGGGGYKTASGPIVSVNDALAAPLRSLVANIEPVQSGSGDPSPDNVRPISGWSAVNVWVKPTYDPVANPTATIQLGQTVYGGYISVGADGSAELVVTHAEVDLGDCTWITAEHYRAGLFGAIITGIKRASPGQTTNAICSQYKTGIVVSSSTDFQDFENGSLHGWRTNDYVYFYDTAFVGYTKDEVKAAMSGVQLCYELATPITIPLTPTEISTLQGANNLWADSGDVTVEYLSAGGANPDLMKLAVAFMGRR